jgi:hypothetical protein
LTAQERVAAERLGVQAHGNVGRSVDGRAEGQTAPALGDVPAYLPLGGEGDGRVGERGLGVRAHERVAVEVTEDETLRRDEPHRQPLGDAHGRVGGRAESKLVARDRHRELGAGSLGDSTAQELPQKRLLARLDAHVAADRQALAAQRRLNRERPPVDGHRGRRNRVLELGP